MSSYCEVRKVIASKPIRPISGTVWEPIRKRAHAQLVREHSPTGVSACWNPGIKRGISVHELISISKKEEKKKKKRQRWGMKNRTFSQVLDSEGRAAATYQWFRCSHTATLGLELFTHWSGHYRMLNYYYTIWRSVHSFILVHLLPTPLMTALFLCGVYLLVQQNIHCASRPQSTTGLSRTVRSVATGTQCGRPMKLHIVHEFMPSRRTESDKWIRALT